MRGNEFLLDVFGSNKYLEDLTGISEMINEQHEVMKYELDKVIFVKLFFSFQTHQIIEMDDSDFELSD